MHSQGRRCPPTHLIGLLETRVLKLETTKDYVWPYGICVSGADRSDLQDKITMAVWRFLVIRTQEIAAGRLWTTQPEDIAAEVHAAWLALPQSERDARRDPKDFAPYASKMIKNKVVDALKAEAKLARIEAIERTNPEAVATDGAPQERDMRRERAAVAYGVVMASLPARQRQAVQLTMEEELSNAEAAEIMGITEGTVKTHLKLAMRDLRSHSEKYWEP
jgi:RNA polymerase sigma factor (sigma-70 family)